MKKASHTRSEKANCLPCFPERKIIMANLAFLFSGQGSQYPGMGKELYQQFPQVRQIYEQASDVFGFDVAATSFEGDEATLAQTIVSQPVIFTHSLAAFTVVSSELCAPWCVAGHSLGEYAAMTAAGVFSREDGFQVIKARAKAMQQASEESDGAMYAIIGSDDETIRKACDAVEGYVTPVNYNSLVQTVIAGESPAAGAAAELLSQQGARAVKLAVSCAFHSKLMSGAAQQFREAVASVAFHTPAIPFYSNLDGKRCESITPDYLASHLTSPVQFVRELQTMAADGADGFLEVGPNKVLSGLVKKTLKGMPCQNVEDLKTLEKAAAMLQKL